MKCHWRRDYPVFADMHEASITQSIIDSVLDTIETQGIKGNVIAVNLTVGVCQGLVPESMQMYFDMIKQSTPLNKAELLVSLQKMTARCLKCEKEHNLDIPVMYCPDCGETMELIHGKEIIISSIEVEE